MKRHSILIAFSAAVCALLSSCSTMKVATDVLKLYPMTCLIDEVAVYEGEKSPANYEHLGTVAVYDQGMTRVTPYETTLDMAKRAVCETGGNAIYISRHEFPNSLVSTNHQIIGQILFDTGGKKASNQGPASGITVKKELSEYVADQYKVPDGPSVVNGNNIYFQVGYGRLATQLDLGDMTVERGSLNNGLSYSLGYEHILPDGKFGLGVFCSNYVSTVDSKRKMEVNVIDSTTIPPQRVYRNFNGKEKIGLHLAGPSVSYSKTNNLLFLSARAGLGFAWQSESFAFSELVSGAGIDSESGVMTMPVYCGAGLQLSGEIGYRLTNLITLSLTAAATEYGLVYTSDTSEQFCWATIFSLCPTLRISL